MKNYPKFFLMFLIVGALSLIVYFVEYYPYKGIDDAYIYFQYAKNFVNGYGFAYIAGGERVEGFTSFVWEMVIILFYSISPIGYPLLLMVLNILLVSYALTWVKRLIDRYLVGPERSASFATALWLALLLVPKGYLDWTVISLLETGLWSMVLLVLSCILIEQAASGVHNARQHRLFIVLISIISITRPEGLLWGPVFIALKGFISFHQGIHGRKLMMQLFFPLVAFVLVTVAITLFRLQYFGYPFPNTYYAKVSGDRIYNLKEGVVYLAKYIFVYPMYLLPLLMAGFSMGYVLVRLRKRPFNDPVLLMQFVLSAIILTCILIPCLVGGDHFPLFRQYQPLMPLFILCFFNLRFIERLLGRVQFPQVLRKARYGLLLMLIPFIYLISLPKYFIDMKKMPDKVSLLSDFEIAEVTKREGFFLNRFFDRGLKPSIGRHEAGGHAYSYEGAVIDLLGLNNTQMAHASNIKVGLKNHAAFDKEVLYRLRPDFILGKAIGDTTDFILPDNRPGFDQNFDNTALKRIFRDERFIKEYQPVLICKTGEDSCVFTYVRNDFILRLEQHGYRINVLKRLPYNHDKTE